MKSKRHIAAQGHDGKQRFPLIGAGEVVSPVNEQAAFGESFRESIEAVLSGDADGLFDAANDVLNLRREEIAEVLYTLAIDRGVPEAQYNLGDLLLGDGRIKDAEEVFAVASDRGDVKSAFALAQILEARGDVDAARIHYLRAIELEWTPVRLARVLRGLGCELEAAEVIRSAVERSGEAAVEWIRSNEGLGLADAIALLERHHERGDAMVLIPLANLYEKDGRIEAAECALRESVELGEVNAFFNLAITILERSGDKIEARRLMKRGAKLGDTCAKQWLDSHQ